MYCPSCGQELPENALFCYMCGFDIKTGGQEGQHSLVGALIGQAWSIDRFIGEGGMGEVYQGSHIHIGKMVAIKALSMELCSHSSIRERFLNEAIVMARLSHPNIAKLLDFREEAGRLFLVMEFVQGQTLQELFMAEGVLPWERTKSIVAAVLKALGYAHKQGIVHRDIKPENIMIRSDGVVKVMDFGIARVVGAARLTRVEGATIGTLAYMSPEQVRGIRDIDGRSDLYSLGIALYEILTGRLPFNCSDEFELRRCHVEVAPSPLRTINSHVPEAVERAVLRLLRKSPDERYPSAEACLQALGLMTNPFGWRQTKA